MIWLKKKNLNILLELIILLPIAPRNEVFENSLQFEALAPVMQWWQLYSRVCIPRTNSKRNIFRHLLNHEGPAFDSGSGPFCVDFVCSPRVSSRGCSFLPHFTNMQPGLVGYSKLHSGVNVSCLSLHAQPEITWWPVYHLHPVAAGRGFSFPHPCAVKDLSANGRMDVGVMISVWHSCFHSHTGQVG